MKNKLYMIIVTIAAIMLCVSCSDEYDGSMPANAAPQMELYNTSDVVSSKTTKVKWYANDADGYKMMFHYFVTSDTLFAEGVTDIDKLISSVDSIGQVINKNIKWKSTDKSFADVSMPYEKYNSDKMYEKFVTDTNLVTDDVPDTLRMVYSKFFLYGTDESGKRTNLVSKIFARTNNRPDFPIIKSTKLGVLGNVKPDWDLNAEQSVMVLGKETSRWKAVDFQWIGKDIDGPDVMLEFSWALWLDSVYTDTNGSEVTKKVLLDSSSFVPYVSKIDGSKDTNPRDYIVDPNVEGSGDGWSDNLRSANFSAAIFDQQYIGYYSFKLHVRDDAQKESEAYAYVKFLAFTPSFTKQILLLDDTDDTQGSKGKGNPDNDTVIDSYKELIEQLDGDVTYDVINFEKPGSGPYFPTLADLADYRLVIITSDDRTNDKGIDQNRYKKTLASYMDIGGKVWTIGAVTFISKTEFGDKYKKPNRHVLYDASFEMVPASDTLLVDYFGLKTITYGEEYEKYRFAFKELRFNFGNYDFVGTGTYEHCEDDLQPMVVDTAKVNAAWNAQSAAVGDGTYKKSWVLKENGTVLPHITTIEPVEAEVCLSYTSIFDLPKVDGSDTLVYNPLRGDDPTRNSLYKPYRSYAWLDTNDVEHWVASSETPYVLRKEGAVGARFVGPNNSFRSAIFSIPLFFMDNSVKEGETVGPVSKNFSEMIDWFEINFNPITGEYEL